MTHPISAPPLTTAVARWFDEAGAFFLRPLTIFKSYRRDALRPDLMAGLTVAVVMLPQARAYALIADLPPQMGLYAAVIASVVGVLWGSSSHLHTGPTNAASLLVLSTLTAVAVAGTPAYIAVAGLLAIMVGVVRLGGGRPAGRVAAGRSGRRRAARAAADGPRPVRGRRVEVAVKGHGHR